ncbi:uncharacterized protein LOC128074156 [Tympanuchus pallidicinctus]|uniref:uncharacterized protein LOC128074156 n=1 Tax=Tympanuchus pallidicinctus TaxID=109042 RepID=UPI002286F557|nr:uncharacterized protein LOC128074156 [Tympanuchus pallidicinctus]
MTLGSPVKTQYGLVVVSGVPEEQVGAGRSAQQAGAGSLAGDSDFRAGSQAVASGLKLVPASRAVAPSELVLEVGGVTRQLGLAPAFVAWRTVAAWQLPVCGWDAASVLPVRGALASGGGAGGRWAGGRRGAVPVVLVCQPAGDASGWQCEVPEQHVGLFVRRLFHEPPSAQQRRHGALGWLGAVPVVLVCQPAGDAAAWQCQSGENHPGLPLLHLSHRVCSAGRWRCGGRQWAGQCQAGENHPGLPSQHLFHQVCMVWRWRCGSSQGAWHGQLRGCCLVPKWVVEEPRFSICVAAELPAGPGGVRQLCDGRGVEAAGGTCARWFCGSGALRQLFPFAAVQSTHSFWNSRTSPGTMMAAFPPPLGADTHRSSVQTTNSPSSQIVHVCGVVQDAWVGCHF